MKHTTETMRELEKIRDGILGLKKELKIEGTMKVNCRAALNTFYISELLDEFLNLFEVKVCADCERLVPTNEMLGHDSNVCPTCAQHEFDMQHDDYRRRILGENI